MLPEIDLGPLDLQTFGICFALGFLAAGAVLARRLKELGKPPDWAYEIIFAAADRRTGRLAPRLPAPELGRGLRRPPRQHLLRLRAGLVGRRVGGASACCCGPAGAASGTSRCSTPAPCRSRSATRSGASAASSRATATTAIASDLPWAMAYPDGTVPTTSEVHPTPSTRRSRWASSRSCCGACATASRPASSSRSTWCSPGSSASSSSSSAATTPSSPASRSPQLVSLAMMAAGAAMLAALRAQRRRDGVALRPVHGRGPAPERPQIPPCSVVFGTFTPSG